MNGQFNVERRPKGYQQLTVSTSAVGLTVPSGASRAVIRVEAQPLRFRDDGANPTSTVGFPKVATNEFELYGNSMRAARFIRSGGTDAVLEVLYYAA